MGAPKARAVIDEGAGKDRFELLEEALERSGFWPLLEQARRASAEPAEDFSILIKPDVTMFDRDSPTGTDLALVEHLIDLLFERGYTRVVVGEGRSSADLWLENRDVLVLAEMIGYRFLTERGHSYEIVDLGADLIEVPFACGSVPSTTCLARPWVEAHFTSTVTVR